MAGKGKKVLSRARLLSAAIFLGTIGAALMLSRPMPVPALNTAIAAPTPTPVGQITFGLKCKGSRRCSSLPGGVCPSTGLSKGDGAYNLAAYWNPTGHNGFETVDQDGKVSTGSFTATFTPGASGSFTTIWTSSIPTLGTQKFFGVVTSSGKKFRGVTTDVDKSAACDGDAQ